MKGLQQLTQQIRRCLGQLVLEHPGKVDTGVGGRYLCVLLRVGCERSLEELRGGRHRILRHTAHQLIYHSAGRHYAKSWSARWLRNMSSMRARVGPMLPLAIPSIT